MTWNEAVEDYVHTLRDSTARQYRVALDDFHRWYIGSYAEDPEPALLTDEELRQWRGHLSGVRKLAASTVNVRLSAVKGLARHHGRTLETEGVRKVKQPIEPLNGRELGRLVAAVEGHQWGPRWLPLRNLAMVAIMARAGLRVGEVVALDMKDIELKERSGWVLIRQGKGLKERKVPLSLQTRKRLQAYLDVRPEWADEALFLTKSGNRVSAGAIQRMVKDAAQRARIDKDVTPHVLRHTFATRFLRKGNDLATLRDILGHASITTTSRYLHPDAAQMQDMVEEL